MQSFHQFIQACDERRRRFNKKFSVLSKYKRGLTKLLKKYSILRPSVTAFLSIVAKSFKPLPLFSIFKCQQFFLQTVILSGRFHDQAFDPQLSIIYQPSLLFSKLNNPFLVVIICLTGQKSQRICQTTCIFHSNFSCRC